MSNWKNTVVKFGFGILLGIFLSLLFRCDPKCPEVSTTTTTEFVTDTITKRHVDTVYIEGPERIIYAEDPNYTELKDDSTLISKFEIDEKDIKGIASIESSDSVRNFQLDYSVICPEITITDTVQITNTVTHTITNTIEKKPLGLYFASNFNISQQKEDLGVGANVFLTIPKKRVIIGGGYTHNFDNNGHWSIYLGFNPFNKK